jgi:hypothetical protein
MTAVAHVNVPSKLLRIDGTFVHDWVAPDEWTQRLRDLSPVSDISGWLELVWEPGDPWIPVQRWTLYEMLHPTLIDDVEELAELYGPHPRSEGHICTSVPQHQWPVRFVNGHYRPCLCRKKTESWRRGPCTIVTLTQWKLFRRTGCVGRPFWTIQGTNGGHKHSFTHEETLLLEQSGYKGVLEPPPAGDMAYAPFDERVVKHITRFNRLWQFRNSLEEYREAMGSGYERYRKTIDSELRRQLVDHLAEQMKEPTDLFLRAARQGQLDKKRRTSIDYERLEDESTRHYIETGQILHESAVRSPIRTTVS